MSVPLRDLVEIHLGYSFRSSLEHDSDGTVGVIQMKDLGSDGLVDLDTLVRVTLDIRPGNEALVDDIIVRSRGGRSTCAMVGRPPGPALVAAPLLRLRVTGERVLPAYLTWYINQPSVQAQLARRAEGSNVKMVNKGLLQDLAVALPPLERQRRIAELAGLSARQRMLGADIDSLRARLLADVMLNYATGSEGQ